jgi:hypothetical protein
MLAGRSLYSDLWDNKPPLLFLTYAVGEVLFGYGRVQVLMLAIIAALVTMIGIFRAGHAVAGEKAGIWAAVFWALLSGDLWLQANQPNAEVFINACLIGSMVLWLRARTQTPEIGRFVAIGLLSLAASMYKQVSLLIPVSLAVAHIFSNAEDKKGLKIAFYQIAIAAIVGAAGWAAAFLYFRATGRGDLFYETMVVSPRYYAGGEGGSLVSNVLAAFTWTRLADPALRDIVPIIMIGCAGVLLGIWKKSAKAWSFVLAYLVSALAAIGLPGRFFPHYFQLLLPPLAIAAGLFCAGYGAPLLLQRKWLLASAGFLVLAITVVNVFPSYTYSPDEWSKLKYGDQFIIARSMGENVREILTQNETVYVWGIEPEIYFWSKKSPPCGIMWSVEMIHGPFKDAFSKRTREELERRPPDLVLMGRSVFIPNDHMVVRWIREKYAIVTTTKMFYVLALKCSSLSKRYGQGTSGCP